MMTALVALLISAPAPPPKGPPKGFPAGRWEYRWEHPEGVWAGGKRVRVYAVELLPCGEARMSGNDETWFGRWHLAEYGGSPLITLRLQDKHSGYETWWSGRFRVSRDYRLAVGLSEAEEMSR